MLTQARVAEAEEIFQRTAEQAPHNWRAKYRHARFLFDNDQRDAGMARLRELGTVMDVGPASGTITVDGRLDEPAWEQSGQVELPFQSYREYVRPAEITTRVHLSYTSDALYVGMYCHDANIDSLEAVKTGYRRAGLDRRKSRGLSRWQS